MTPAEEAVYHYLIWKGLEEPHRGAYLKYWKDYIPGLVRMVGDENGGIRPARKGQYRKALYAALTVFFALAMGTILWQPYSSLSQEWLYCKL